jgi:hypothetical protein
MFTGIVLVGLAVACRLLSPVFHIWNFVPAGAVALYAGSRLPRRWAWAVPLAAMFLSDLILNDGDRYPIFSLARWTVYGTLAATTLLGRVARSPRVRPWMLPGLGVSASVLFFVTTNFATWAEGQLYPMTWSGLTTCYVMAIPFFWNTLAADLLGTCVLFGLGPVFERAAARVSHAWGRQTADRPEAAELSEVA